VQLENRIVSLSAIATDRQWFSGDDIEKAAPATRGILRPWDNPGGGIYV